MHWSEVFFGLLLVLILLSLSLYFGRQQILALRRLRTLQLPDEEMQYERRKAYRRLISSGLTLLLGIILALQLLVYGPTAQQLADERAAFNEANAPEFTPEQRWFLRIWGWGWVAFLLVLFVVVILAGLDLFTTRRYGIKQYRKIQDDRRAMIQRQISRMRREQESEKDDPENP